MNSAQPPRLATWLLLRLTPQGETESLIGDLMEEYQSRQSSAWYWYQVLIAILSTTGSDLTDHLGRVVAWTAVSVMVVLGCLLVPPSRHLPPALLVYIVPQALGLALPIGLVIGIVLALGGHNVSKRLFRVTLGLAIFCSCVSFVNVGWVTPLANHAFHAAITGTATVVDGPSEMTFGQLNRKISLLRQIGQVDEAHRLLLKYDTHVAISFAAFPLAFFALSVLTRRGVGRLALTTAICIAVLAYYVLAQVGISAIGQYSGLAAAAGAWLPNAALVAVAAMVLKALPPAGGTRGTFVVDQRRG